MQSYTHFPLLDLSDIPTRMIQECGRGYGTVNSACVQNMTGRSSSFGEPQVRFM